MRHGEAENNVKRVVSASNVPHHLTALGKEQTRQAAKKLLSEKIDIIVASPMTRVRETTELVSEILKLNPGSVKFDERLREFDAGEFDGRSEDEIKAYFSKHNIFTEGVPGGETFITTKRRVGTTLQDLEATYQGKNILIITHKICAWLLVAAAKRLDNPGAEGLSIYMKNGEVITLDTPSLPCNEDFELDLHRPYIDEVALISEEGEPLKRIPEVIDGWVESGSMPFAEYHYPFEDEKTFKKHFPADFIAEYIAQTRTWFYYMHAVATLLFDNISFRNVLTTGTILAEDGSKMSKSKGNYTDPIVNLDLFGADALRYYLMSSVVMQAEDIRFINDEVRQVHNQVLNIIWNSFKFYELYADDEYSNTPHASKCVLDRWILSRLDELTETVTQGMDAYDTVRATRPMKEFISDFSTWYIRRSRERFKGDDQEDKAFAIVTTRYVLLELSKLLAPITPFIAEDIYQKIRRPGDRESVHLEDWPTVKKSSSNDKKIIKDMAETRRIASLALEARSRVDIKVRQSLNELKIRSKELGEEFLSLIARELNVKRVTIEDNLATEVELDTRITPELEEEGKLRDVIRMIQDFRKEKDLSPKDKIKYEVPDNLKELFAKYAEDIKKATNIEF